MSGEVDPFDALGVEARFDLSAGDVRRAYLGRAALAHPDRVGGEADAARGSAVLNRARDVLIDPEKRASALLVRLGGPAGADEKGLPDGFLMEIMETRQEIESDLAADASAARERWGAWADERRDEAIAEVEGMFAALGDEPGPEALAAIRRRLNAWRYIERLIEQLDPGYDPQKADFSG